MKQVFINIVLGVFMCIGVLYWLQAATVMVGNQNLPSGRLPCKVITTREDEALDPHMHLSELSKPEFLKNFAQLAAQPMARVEFPLLKSQAGNPIGRSPVQITTAFIDSSWAKWTFPFTYRVNNQEYVGEQAVYPVPLWADLHPDFSKEGPLVAYDPADPGKDASCPAIIGWQVKQLLFAGLLFVIIPAGIMWFVNQQMSTADSQSIDKIYNERFGRRK